MSTLKTEMRNPLSTNMDKMDSVEMARLVINANYEAVKATEDAAVEIAEAVDVISCAFRKGGRLFYIGAGTSGRLGVLDASECPPTFGVPYDQVQGIIAGGKERMFRAGENEEDKYESGAEAIKECSLTANDVVVGISAAGGAKFVIGALECAKSVGAKTVAISNNPDTAIHRVADVKIFLDTGAEVLTGSTRLKAGTAQKIVLNTLTTCAMTKSGKVYENMMINLAPSNEKLKLRVIRITREILGCDEDTAVKHLDKGEWNIRRAIALADKEHGYVEE